MTRFERLTLAASLAALILSGYAALKTSVSNAVGTMSATLSLQRESPIFWNFGRFELFPYFQIYNDGVAEIRPESAELTLTMDSGESITLVAENFIPNGATWNSLVGLTQSELS